MPSQIEKYMYEQETEMEMIRRHVRQGIGHVLQQRERVAKLHASGQSTEVASQILATFETTQRQHEAHLARLEGAPPVVGTEYGEA